MDMPGRFPDELYDTEPEVAPSVYELPGSSPPKNTGVSLSSKAGPVEWQLPGVTPDEEDNSPTKDYDNCTSESKKKLEHLSRSSASAKPSAIAVFGVTGTGKSTFISTLTGEDVGIGHGLKSCTSEIEEVHYRLGMCNIALIDTPGFNDIHRTDTDVLREIASWMKHAYDQAIPLTGVIYLHRISDVRMSGSSYVNLKMFQSLCGKSTLNNVILASTMWDKVTLEEGEKREKELFDDQNFWGNLMKFGAKTWRYDNTQGTAMAMVNYLLQKDPIMLRIQREVAVEKKALIDTSAGRSINIKLNELEKTFNNELALV